MGELSTVAPGICHRSSRVNRVGDAFVRIEAQAMGVDPYRHTMVQRDFDARGRAVGGGFNVADPADPNAVRPFDRNIRQLLRGLRDQVETHEFRPIVFICHGTRVGVGPLRLVVPADVVVVAILLPLVALALVLIVLLLALILLHFLVVLLLLSIRRGNVLNLLALRISRRWTVLQIATKASGGIRIVIVRDDRLAILVVSGIGATRVGK